ncbi:copper ion binding [Striga asiatica]|uniref:Copper ion binding n=1 Tax=Striga asiatica TaxID=4170 RepID=A0A5A7P5S3_STRAF|nr:copper ion binding [Striga asiatica]
MRTSEGLQKQRQAREPPSSPSNVNTAVETWLEDPLGRLLALYKRKEPYREWSPVSPNKLKALPERNIVIFEAKSTCHPMDLNGKEVVKGASIEIKQRERENIILTDKKEITQKEPEVPALVKKTWKRNLQKKKGYSEAVELLSWRKKICSSKTQKHQEGDCANLV